MIFSLGCGAAIWWVIRKKSNSSGESGFIAPNGAGSPALEKWRYRHEGLGTAIALCPSERVVRLRAKFPGGIQTKDYGYGDIREWKFNISSGGMHQSFGRQSFGAAVGMGVANLSQARKNEAETGLFLMVKDIDFPEWQVKFPPSRQREFEIKRWMEILRQELNEGSLAPA